MFEKELSYLKQDDISGVLVEGLTILYQRQPERPIEFFANWLQDQVDKKHIERRNLQKVKQFEITRKHYVEKKQEEDVKREEERKEQEKAVKFTADLCRVVESKELVEDTVNSQLMQYVKEVFNLNEVSLLEHKESKLVIKNTDQNNLTCLVNKDIPVEESSIYELFGEENKELRQTTYGDINNFKKKGFLNNYAIYIKEKDIFFDDGKRKSVLAENENRDENKDEVLGNSHRSKQTENRGSTQRSNKVPITYPDRTVYRDNLISDELKDSEVIEQFLDANLKEVETYVKPEAEEETAPKLHFKTDKNILYIPDIIETSKKVFFFKTPKFGSQLGIKINVNEYRSSASFDDYIEKLNVFKNAEADLLQKEKDEQEHYEQRLAELKENGEDTVELEESHKNRVKEKNLLVMPKSEIKSFVMLFDNLGTDIPLSLKDLNRLYNLTCFIEKSWNISNFRSLQVDELIYSDLNTKHNREAFMEEEADLKNEMVKIEDEVPDIIKEMEDNENQEGDDNEEKEENDGQESVSKKDNGKIPQSQLEDPELLREYLTQEKQLTVLKNYVKKHLSTICELSKLNFIKYDQIFQLMLFLLKKNKREVNKPLKTPIKPNDNEKTVEGDNLTESDFSDQFDWMRFKSILKESTFEELFNYEPKGLKNGEYNDYNKVNKIKALIDTIEPEETGDYYFPLNIFLRYLKAVIEFRLIDIKRRRQCWLKYDSIRSERIKQKEEREERKKTECEEAKNQFYSTKEVENENKDEEKKDKDDEEESEDEDESESKKDENESEAEVEELEFNEQKWLSEWDEKNPDIIIPENVVEEFDTDVTQDFFANKGEEEE